MEGIGDKRMFKARDPDTQAHQAGKELPGHVTGLELSGGEQQTHIRINE